MARWPTSPPTTSTTGQVFGCCEDTTGILPFTAAVTPAMTQQPHASLLTRLDRHQPAEPDHAA
ncbi:hypothetical protein BN11_1520024 [Nostocoides australiense Ben110]|uniref:Uncharacterized protein n=1 Tax=Nostocoides australiense Ben110 TaxID=1193182 RepID=W6JUR6_9MICO|nr:hypothetical protein BN11_1520024 [Tetrasphaera australiensis Ben110]